jgi:hypothetical protein
MRTINHDRRAVGIGLVGMALVALTLAGFELARGIVDKSVSDREHIYQQGPCYRMGQYGPEVWGGTKPPVWGEEGIAFTRWTSIYVAPKRHDTTTCFTCKRNEEGKRQILVSFVPGKEKFVATRFGESDWRITSMESSKHKYGEEGPYVITNEEPKMGLWEAWTFQDAAEARKGLKFWGSRREKENIKVFRSYRIDPEELEGSK